LADPARGPASLAVIPGAGSAGQTWSRAAALLGATVFPVPDRPDVAAMAAALRPQLEALPEPRVLLGASLGAMVGLEVARELPVAGLVLLATGWGIEVGDSFLEWVATGPPDLFGKMAKTSIAARDDVEAIAACVRDFEARGQAVVHRHLAALGAYRPEPFADPPPTLVLWGEKDRSVPLADHAALALQMHGVLVPIPGVAHKPFFERPEETVSWIRWWLEAEGL
jgi:pimeloyl-ACP methyl ester carboxylesterase